MTSHTSRISLLRSLNCDGAYALGLALCVLLLLAPLAGGDALTLLGRYERTAIASGQWWRLVTGHIVHLDANHALLNAVGLALLWALFARSYRAAQWLAAVALSVVVIDLGFWFLSPQLQWYVGASGVLHGVFACGCLALIRQRDRIGVIAGLVFTAKLFWEQWHGPLPFEETAPVVTVAHLYGAIGGVLAGLILRARREPLY